MGKLAIYILVMSGLMLLFYSTGLLENTGSSTLLNMLLDPAGYKTSSLNTQLLLVLTGIATAGIIVIGILTRDVELALMGSLAIWILNLLWDFIAVFNIVYSLNPIIAILLFSPVLLLYGVTVVDWWRGRD